MLAEIKNVTKRIAGKVIIDDVSFTLRKGEIIALVGPNGAGKTTLLSLITNLLMLDSGTVKLNGINIEKDPKKSLQEVSFMQDNSTLYQHLTGYQHLKFIANVKDKKPKDMEAVIDRLKIKEYINNKVSSYSLGMKQHLLLAIALLSNPKLLIMDEPLNGLDPTSSLLVREIILDLKKSGTTVLFSSHLLDEIDKISDRIIFIKSGKVLAEKNLKEIDKDSKTFNLKVNDMEHAMVVLEKLDEIIRIQKINEDTLQLEFRDCEINKIIKHCALEDVDILDVERKTIQTELVYHDLIGDKNE